MNKKRMVVYKFEKNENDVIEFGFQRFKSIWCVYIWKLFKNKSGEFVYTKKGISMSLKHLEEIKKGIDELLSHMPSSEDDSVDLFDEGGKQNEKSA